MARPAIGHRTEECARLWKGSREMLSKVMFTQNEIVMLTSPASAMMEAAIRNTVSNKSLHLVCGAFSKRWFEIAKSTGVDAIAIEKDIFIKEELDNFMNELDNIWHPEKMLEVQLKEPDDFLKVRETLTRIGVASRKDNPESVAAHSWGAKK